MKKISIILYVIIFVKMCGAEDCSNLDPENCYDYVPTQEDGTKRCILLEGNCVLKECQDLTDCEAFPTIGEGDEMKKCLNTNEGCQLKNCSELDTNNCQNFGYDNRGLKCLTKMSKVPGEPIIFLDYCELQRCTDMPAGFCDLFSNDEIKCHENEDYTECELINCSDLKPGQCYKAYYDNYAIQCLESEDGKRCEIRKCSDYKTNECSKYLPFRTWAKCLPGENGCEEKECGDLTPPNCGRINPLRNNLYSCEENNGFCMESIKSCEELPYKYCSLYINSIYYSQEKSEKCIKNEKTKKCELTSCETTSPTQCNTFMKYALSTLEQINAKY